MLPPDEWRSVFGTLAHNRAFTVQEVREYAGYSGGMGLRRPSGSAESIVRGMVRDGLLKSTSRGRYAPTAAGWEWIETGKTSRKILQIQRVGGAQAEQAKSQGLTKVNEATARRLWDADVPFFMAGDKVGGHALFGHWNLAAHLNPAEAKQQGATFDVMRNRFVAYLEPQLGRHAAYFVETKLITEDR